MARYICSHCGTEYPTAGLPSVCSECGGVFTLVDLHYSKTIGKDQEIFGMWRYRESFGLPNSYPITYLGEGGTPLVSKKFEGQELTFKMEHLNPSGSFKDRGTAVLTSVLVGRKISEVVEDSSGNAGSALALYASAFGVGSRIYIPLATSGPKRRQIEASGANVIVIEGKRERAHQAAIEAVELEKLPYASHALLPFGLSGYATIAFEVYEQLGELPGTVIAPAGHGSLLLGLILGLEAISSSLSRNRETTVIGVQPENCAPIVRAWRNEPFGGVSGKSVAEGTQVETPVRCEEIIQKLQNGKDDLLTVSETEIILAYHELSHNGMYVEPTSAMVLAAWKKQSMQLPRPIVLILSGSGLKSNLPL